MVVAKCTLSLLHVKMFKLAHVLYFCCGVLALVASKHVPGHRHQGGNREGRWFGYRYTSTEVIPKMVTSLIPSSCVQVEASLPPCRNVRNLEEFPTFLRGYRQEENVNHQVMPTIHTTVLGWGEYLGIYAPTVTVTAVELRTTTVLDPKTVVTFSVKGCKPSRLPMDLNLCPSHSQQIMPEIKPTATVTDAIVPTTTAFGNPSKPINLDNAEGLEVPNNNLDQSQNVHAQMLQPTDDQLIAVHPNNHVETQPLPL